MKKSAVYAGLLTLSAFSLHAQAQGYLENPQPNSAKSGISVVSGWNCDANVIEFQIDDRRLVSVPYGSERKDTESVCGDWDNGFSFLMNYSGMGDGTHTITVYADGVPFGQATFQVATLGEAFARGLQRSVVATNFPAQDTDTVLRWQESSQSFQIESVGVPHSIVGSWDTGNSGNGEVLTFHSDGTYVVVGSVHECDLPGNPEGWGIEAGTYSYDEHTQQLTILSVARDENGSCGIADNYVPKLGIRLWRDQGVLRIADPIDGDLEFPKIP